MDRNSAHHKEPMAWHSMDRHSMDRRQRQAGNALVVMIAFILALGICVAGYFLVLKESPAVQEPAIETSANQDDMSVGAGDDNKVTVSNATNTTNSESSGKSNFAARPKEEVSTEEPVEVAEGEQNVRIHGKVLSLDGEPIADVQLRWVDATHRDLKNVRHDPRLTRGQLSSKDVSADLAKSLRSSKTTQTSSSGSFELLVGHERGVVIASSPGYSTVIQDLEGDDGSDGGIEDMIGRISEISQEMEDIEDAIKGVDASEDHAGRTVAVDEQGNTQITVELNFELQGAASVSGRVIDDENGSPATGMTVVLLPHTPGGGGGFMAMIESQVGGRASANPSAIVDEQGNFEVVGIKAGEYNVLPKTGRSDYVSLPTKKASRVTLRSGDAVEGLVFKVSLGGVISGIVSDTEGNPISKARVMCVPNIKAMDFMGGDMDIFSMFEERDNLRTDENGVYTVTALPLDQEYQVSARHDEYASSKGDLVTIDKKNKQAQVDISLLRGSTVSGYVHYENGSVAANVSVRLQPDMKEMMSGGGISAFAVMSDGLTGEQTDDQGFFEFKNVSPGSYTVLSGTSWDFSPFGESERGEKVEVDGENDITDIQLVVKDDGEDVVEEPTGTLVGRVVDDTGSPVAGASLNFWAMDGNGSGTSDDDGRFEIDVTGEGPYNANIMHSGFTNYSESGFKISEKELVLTLKRLAGVSGMVTTSDGAFPEGGKVSVRPVVEDMSGMQRMFDGFGGGGRSAELETDGSYFLEGVPAGKVEIVANVPGYAPGRSEQLEIEAGVQVENVNIRVSPGATLTGKVKASDKPLVEGASVRLSRSTGNKSLEMLAQMMPAFFQGDGGDATTDDRGRYEIPHLAPGTYNLTVTHEDYAPSKPIKVEIGDQREVTADTVELAPGGSIEGYVLHGEEKTPVPGATVQLIGEGPMKMGQTDKNGQFEFEGLPYGEYMLQVMNLQGGASGFNPKTTTVNIEGSSPAQVEVLLGVGVKITGKVEGLKGGGFQQILVREIDAPRLEDLDMTDMSSLLEAAKHNVAQGIVIGGEYELEGIEPGTYFIEIPAMPDDPSDFEAYAEMDRTPHYRSKIVVAKQDLVHDIRVSSQ